MTTDRHPASSRRCGELRRLAPIVSALVTAASTVTACGTEPAAPAPPPPRLVSPGGITCLPLPGAFRDALVLLPDGQRALVVEGAVDAAGRPRRDLVLVGLRDGHRSVLAEGVGWLAPSVAGDRVVLTKHYGEPRRVLGRPQRLYSVPLAGGEAVPLTDERLDVSSFAIDEEHGLVYFSSFVEGGQSRVLKASLSGGPPADLAPGHVVWAVTDGGQSVLIRAQGLSSVGTEKLPVEGGQAVWLAADGFDLTVLGDRVVYTARGDAEAVLDRADARPAGPLQVMPLAGGPAGPLAGSREGDRLVGPPRLVRRDDGDARGLLRIDASGLTPLVSVTGADPIAAALLEDGTVVALLLLDTTGDGRRDDRDEADLCLLGSGPGGPIAAPARDVPLALVQKAANVRELVGLLGFEGAKVRFDGAAEVHVDVPSPWGSGPDALLARVKEAQPRIAAAVGDPRAGLALSYSDGWRASRAWDPDRARLVASVARGDVVLADREGFEVELFPRTRTVSDIYSGVETATCSGTVKNLGGAPLTLEAECSATPSSYGLSEGVPAVTKRAPTRPAVLPPGGSGTFEVALGRVPSYAGLDMRLLSGERELDYFNAYSDRDGREWLATLDAIRSDGFEVLPADRFFVLGAHDRQPAFRAPPGFEALEATKQRSLAGKLWSAVRRHYADLHDGSLYEVGLVGPGGLRWEIRDGRLAPVASR